MLSRAGHRNSLFFLGFLALLALFYYRFEPLGICALALIGIGFARDRSEDKTLNLDFRPPQKIPAPYEIRLSFMLERWARYALGALLAASIMGIVFMVVSQDVPISQKIYVYSLGCTFSGLLISSMYSAFESRFPHKSKNIYSLPIGETEWQNLDRKLVLLLYYGLQIPFALLVMSMSVMGIFVPLIVLPLHGISLWCCRGLILKMSEAKIYILLLVCVISSAMISFVTVSSMSYLGLLK